MVLYLCTSRTCHVIPSYSCGSGVCTSVSSWMKLGSVWVVYLFAWPGFIVIFAFLFNLWCGAVSGHTVMAGCCVLPLHCGGSGVCYTIISWSGGVDGYCGTSMLNMANNWFSSAVCFSTSCRVRLDGDGFYRASVRSAAACVTAYDGYMRGYFFCAGNISIMLETRSRTVLGMC